MKNIKIFLASSEELKEERVILADMVQHLNYVLEKQNIHVQLVKWEYLDSSMGDKHKQEEYNDALRECEMCVVLYWTRFGKYTKTELDTADSCRRTKKNPRKLWVYFKESNERTPELQEFYETFENIYGHFFCNYKNIDTLRADFLLQFMDFQGELFKNNGLIEVRDSKVFVAGKEYVELKNVPFAGNNEDYNNIKEEILELKEDLEDISPESPRYSKKAKKLNDLREKLSKMESSLWNTALTITKLTNENCSERLKRAMQLFNEGDNKGANALLNEDDIRKDAKHNLNLIRLGEEGKEGLKTNIEEYNLKIKTLENEMSKGWCENILALRLEILEWVKVLYGDTANYVEALENIGKTYDDMGDFPKAIDYYNNAIEIIKKIQYTDTALEASVLCNLSISERNNGNISYAKELLEKSLSIMENCIGQDNYLMAQILINYGALYNDKINSSYKAQSLYKKALKILTVLSEDNDISKGNIYNNIAVSLNDFLAFDEKLEYFSSAYEIYVSLNADLELSFLLNALGTAYEHRHDYFHAFINYYHCLQLQINLLGDDHVTTISTQEDVKYTFNCLQQLNLMDEVMNEDFTLKYIDNEKDSEITALLYHKLVQMDDPQAKFVLSEITNEDSDMDEMSDDSYKLLLSAASSDFAEAQYTLGVYMYNMSKSTEDKNNSLSWLEKAALQNFPDAIYMIGNIYLTDNEIDHSIEEAIAYLQKAAELYYTDAFNDLAWAYHISNDNINALKWAKLAVEEFPEDSNCRDTLAKIYIDLNNFHEAIEQLEKCVELQKAEGTDHQTLSKTINLINHVDNIIES